ncbi:hypothetical protein KHA80_11710 [Anaerobacillus sp. HL2]|nr:hypothetical protein KHA80_11710 [Anaerobacillus sp. HL2]
MMIIFLNIPKDRIMAKDESKPLYLAEYTSSVIKVKDEVAPTVTSIERVSATQYKHDIRTNYWWRFNI